MRHLARKSLHLSFVLGAFAAMNGVAESPSIKNIFPTAVVPGRATEVTFFGSALAGATNLWTSFEAKVENVRSAEDRAVFKFSSITNRSPGIGALRLAGTNGISNLQFIMIDGLQETIRSESNHTVQAAQELKLPVAVEGTCDERMSDFFKFTARKGERLTFEVVAQRFGSVLDPLVRLLEPGGRELVFCEDTPGAGIVPPFPATISETPPRAGPPPRRAR